MPTRDLTDGRHYTTTIIKTETLKDNTLKRSLTISTARPFHTGSFKTWISEFGNSEENELIIHISHNVGFKIHGSVTSTYKKRCTDTEAAVVWTTACLDRTINKLSGRYLEWMVPTYIKD